MGPGAQGEDTESPQNSPGCARALWQKGCEGSSTPRSAFLWCGHSSRYVAITGWGSWGQSQGLVGENRKVLCRGQRTGNRLACASN